MKKIEANWASLKKTKRHEYAVRFFFGGLCTVAAGLIAKRFGPSVGGLFLAFPAIFPASASLIESHEKRRKAKIGFDGCHRGRMAASLDSRGASLGCVGLLAFAFVLWRWVDGRNAGRQMGDDLRVAIGDKRQLCVVEQHRRRGLCRQKA
jgi:Protein of unknown function (DUF3147)